MSKFLFVYHGGGMAESEDAQAKAMAAWGAWFGQLGGCGGRRRQPDRRQCHGEGGRVKPRGGANPATGYSLIEASSIEDAAEKAKGCPILSSGGSIEVCETINVEM